ncbi:AzlD domain-containing protein [Acinetobacter bouvetii]|uniref:Branched-chain amino acid transport protein (AzlD) n=1 Tax=Acinetobacter bouvetii TaxID=202951 RepID=A0A811GAX0_9GAMM|nr:AzlD domain-containing protein [Acinetobacter bouvetii]CAB1214704.1 Branched-chain amino acid transport protein (AzlD) [Acinetobacter bouvetii]
MTWLFVLSLTCVTFFNRYLFLEPKTQIWLPFFVTRMLKYAAPCLMISICVPLIFFENGQPKFMLQNSYLYGAIFTLFITLFSKKLLLSILLSLGFFMV